MSKRLFNKKSFTLIELIVVCVIISIISAFAIVNFSDMAERTRFNQARNNLRMIYEAQRLFFVRNNEIYLGHVFSLVGAINAGLRINIIEGDFRYQCIAIAGPEQFVCEARRLPLPDDYRLQVKSYGAGGAVPLGVDNPCCVGACPISIPCPP